MTWQLYNGDALTILKELPSESVHCCVTSPPYWGLRDYGVDGQLGLEPTPEEYVANIVEVFREVKRVLRSDATLWLNLGDSYAGSGKGRNADGTHSAGVKQSTNTGTIIGNISKTKISEGLKPKDLAGIPWRVALALQADGWWLRSDIIWEKGNPMPESVTDRPTKAHEYIFLLSKSARYFYDAEAIREPHTHKDAVRNTGDWAKSVKEPGYADALPEAKKANRSCAMSRPKDYIGNINGRNKRTVWNISTKPFSEAHFAVFPPEIPETCIKAGTSEKGCCPKCGSPWERVIEKVGGVKNDSYAATKTATVMQGGKSSTTLNAKPPSSITIDWQPTCSCEIEETIPCTVLDPFAGAGTTLWVAEQLGVNSIGIELNPEYCELIEKRMNGIELDLFAMEGR